jgi:hypothetical protein
MEYQATMKEYDPDICTDTHVCISALTHSGTYSEQSHLRPFPFIFVDPCFFFG